MIRRISQKRLAIALLLCFALSACKDDMRALANALNDTANAVATIQQVVIAANQNGLMTVAQTRPVLEMTAKVATAGGQATEIAKKLNELKPEDRTNLSLVLAPITQALLDGNGPVSQIPDPAVRQRVQGAVTTITTALTTAQLVLKGGN